MKQIVFFLMIATFFPSCKNECTCNGYTVNQDPCECVVFQGEIGSDFDSALDSLKKLHAPLFNTLATEGHYSGKGYYIEKEKLNVDFTEDDRDFFRLTYVDSISNRFISIHYRDVLDENGNYYQHRFKFRD